MENLVFNPFWIFFLPKNRITVFFQKQSIGLILRRYITVTLLTFYLRAKKQKISKNCSRQKLWTKIQTNQETDKQTKRTPHKQTNKQTNWQSNRGYFIGLNVMGLKSAKLYQFDILFVSRILGHIKNHEFSEFKINLFHKESHLSSLVQSWIHLRY